MKVNHIGLSRRRLLQGMGGTLGILGLAACGTVATAPAPEEQEAMAPKEEQKAPEPAEPAEVEFLIGPFAGRSADAMDTLAGELPREDTRDTDQTDRCRGRYELSDADCDVCRCRC